MSQLQQSKGSEYFQFLAINLHRTRTDLDLLSVRSRFTNYEATTLGLS
jgi:hypothetical protein